MNPQQFTRARINKKFCGVFGGVENHFGVSATMLRFAFILSTLLFAGWNIPVYFMIVAITKKEPIVPPIYQDYGVPRMTGGYQKYDPSVPFQPAYSAHQQDYHHH